MKPSPRQQGTFQPAIRLIQTIVLPGVEGRMDHLAADLPRGRLFVAALGNDTVEVIDLKAGERVATLAGVREPQGIAVDSRNARVFVASGQGGSVRVFDAGTLRPLRTLPLGDDADNTRLARAEGRLYVGFGDGALAVVDSRSDTLINRIPLAGHPESFQLETAGTRLFVNVPSRHHIAVVDRGKGKVIATWPLTGAAANFPMALDESGHRLFVGCRNPAALLVFDSETGNQVTRCEISGDTDDLFWDTTRKLLYASCGAGYLDIVRQETPDRYRRIGHQPTATGARTALYLPELSRLYLAVPHHGAQAAKISVYEIPNPL